MMSRVLIKFYQVFRIFQGLYKFKALISILFIESLVIVWYLEFDPGNGNGSNGIGNKIGYYHWNENDTHIV